jgi:hypothetical protein
VRMVGSHQILSAHRVAMPGHHGSATFRYMVAALATKAANTSGTLETTQTPSGQASPRQKGAF